MSPKPSKQRSRCASFWKDGHRQARADIRKRWRTGGLQFLAVAWLTGVVLSLALLVRLATTTDLSSLTSDRFVACQPNGLPDIYPDRYRYWAGSGFFQITLGWGKLSFTQAKVIDVAWDIIFARGGQALIAYISWHVFTNYVTTSMETGPITFSTYRTVFLRNESLVFAIYRLFRNFARRRQLHSRIAMAFMVMTMIFILIFPSFSSAMTGYSASVKSYVRDNSNVETIMANDNNNYMAFSSFKRILYVIHDGWRVGEDGDFVVPYHTPYETKFTDPVLFSSDYFDSQIVACTRIRQSIPEDSRCQAQLDVAIYVGQHGFHGLANVNSSFRGTLLDPPALNITAYYLPDDSLGANWTDPYTGLQPFRDFSKTMWSYQNVTYNIQTISEQLACQPVKTYYWGFSFIQLNIMLILCIIWTIGISAMWIQSYMTMKQRGRTHVAGEYKAVLELAHAITTQLHDAGQASAKEVLDLSESELRRRFKKDLNDGSIAYEAPLMSTGQHGFKTWLLAEMWWLAAILVVLGGFFSLCLLMPYAFSWVLGGFLAALVLTVCIGTTGMSRAVLLGWGIMVFCGLPLAIWLPVMYYTYYLNG
ncbi:hypothetical protein FB567DRAFT_592502 [Paraphoma chrysanthemicola]|uniref:Uncharacterized protein n=1 Tax=Paraphoma chrysanthemicola TaxID=798071 RepID=A0A8K0R552_9PLEO|nr:hypothetical protein FB567DRAFT_592502 [Paraphoma chrysanthemicola]